VILENAEVRHFFSNNIYIQFEVSKFHCSHNYMAHRFKIKGDIMIHRKLNCAGVLQATTFHERAG
jgi:hypothetical protein